MGLYNLFNKQPKADEIIKKLIVVSASYDSPIQLRFSLELSSKVLYEIYVFHFFFAWLYNLDKKLIELTDSNIARYHVSANMLLNHVCKKEISHDEFQLLFAERFANYRQELSLFRKHQFDGNYFPTYFYETILKEMLESCNHDSYVRHLTQSELASLYSDSVNYIKDEFDKAFK